MRPVVHLQIDLQSDNANIADAYYGGRAVQQWYQQQAGSTETLHLSPISPPADWVATGPLRSLHACLATPTSTPLEPTVHFGPTPTTPSQPGAQLGPAATTPFQPPPGPTATTPSQPGSQPVPVLDGIWRNADVNGALHGRLFMACMTSLQP
ncbi:hypothetical protein HaLaN_25832 [Haematococcus lacustris]|uniref:Uncharacterized protein n=1 Tax=Haematococcus lacustris TaxID=44745 RepID=A0A6A0A555_HAELA|nr:hypothetical protein HaLaN_25832 [Haematococcus lacustris]